MLSSLIKNIVLVFFSFLVTFSLTLLIEGLNIGLFQNYAGYSFGLNNGNPWFYETPQLYAKVVLIEGLLLSSLSGFTLYFFVKKQYSKSNYSFISFVIVLILMVVQSNLF